MRHTLLCGIIFVSKTTLLDIRQQDDASWLSREGSGAKDPVQEV
jgi:hypothetical protein